MPDYSVVVDCMGGDFAPDEILKGAISGSKKYGISLKLVGERDRIIRSAGKNNLDISGIPIINSTDSISMDDAPSDVIKRKQQSPVFLGTLEAARFGRNAFLSAGNTGAVMACSLFNMKKIEGLLRPAIAVVIPVADKRFVLIDAGANVEMKPLYLKQFAIMGKVYANQILKIVEPRIGLLNVGSEEKKGTETVVEGYKLLKNTKINFIGNVEGRDIFEGKADVVVCDGFTGNILLKSIEGMAGFFFSEIKSLLYTNFMTRFSALLLKNSLRLMKKKFDYEEYGGALLIGINGISIISHGSSKARAIENAVQVADESLKGNIVNKIREEIER